MALRPDFPDSFHAVLDPSIRWFPADEALRDTTMGKLMPPLAAQPRRKLKEFRDGGYGGAVETSWTGSTAIFKGWGFSSRIRSCRTTASRAGIGATVFN